MGTTGTTSEPPRLTFEEWGDLPEDEGGELVDGRLVEEEVPTHVHEAVVILVASWLMGWVGPQGGTVGGSNAKFAVTPKRGRRPDLYAYFPRRLPPGNARVIDLPPDIMVEVVTPTPKDERRDRVEKVPEYAAFGVKYYWIVDPGLRSLEVFELGEDGRYVHALGATEGRLTSIPGCAGLTIDLDTLWSEVDRLSTMPS